MEKSKLSFGAAANSASKPWLRESGTLRTTRDEQDPAVRTDVDGVADRHLAPHDGHAQGAQVLSESGGLRVVQYDHVSRDDGG